MELTLYSQNGIQVVLALDELVDIGVEHSGYARLMVLVAHRPDCVALEGKVDGLAGLLLRIRVSIADLVGLFRLLTSLEGHW